MTIDGDGGLVAGTIQEQQATPPAVVISQPQARPRAGRKGKQPDEAIIGVGSSLDEANKVVQPSGRGRSRGRPRAK